MIRSKTTDLDRPVASEKTEAILRGAMEQFLAHGYAATSMDKVAAAAGVSKATVYSHFGDKEGLFTVLVQRLAEKKFALIFDGQSQLGDSGGDIRAVFRKTAHIALDEMHCNEEHRAFCRLIIGESGRFPALAKIFVEHHHKPGMQRLVQFLQNCPGRHFPDPQATGQIIVGTLVHYMQIQEMLHGREIMPLDRDRLVNVLVDTVLASSQALVR
jgi:TetR/AcrR family transcriptional regulator, regulator of autoinduction and epiphytic fitness